MFKEKVNKYQEETKEFINKWEEKSREFISTFLENFGNSTTILKDKVQRAMSPRPSRRMISSSDMTSSNRRDTSSTFSLPSLSDYKQKYLGALRHERKKKQILSSNSDDYDTLSDSAITSISSGSSKRSSDEPSIKRAKLSNKNDLSSDDENDDDDDDDDYHINEDRQISTRSTTSNKIASGYKRLKSELKPIKKLTRATSKLNELEDVDDELDNQIPLI